MDRQTVDRLLAQIDEERLIKLERDMVRIPSPTMQETALAEYLANYMEEIGVDEVELHEVANPDNPERRSKQPVGRLKGDGQGPSLMFNGHMDHRPLVGEWDRDPFGGDLEDGWIYGRGSQDEKGGITAFIVAAEAIKKAGIPLKGDILLAPVMGHKVGGIGTKYLIDKGITADMVINSENSGLGIVPATVGVIRLRVRTKGKSLQFLTVARQADRYWGRNLDAIEMLLKVANALGRSLRPMDPKGWLSFQPHEALPGFPQLKIREIKTGHGPTASLAEMELQLKIREIKTGYGTAEMEFEVHTVPGQTDETLKTDIEGLLDRFRAEDPDFQAEAEVIQSIPPMITPTDHVLVQTLAKWHGEIAQQKPDVSSHGRLGAASDGNILAAAGMTAVQYGPGDLAIFDEWPTPNERILIKDIVIAAKAMALTAVELCGRA